MTRESGLFGGALFSAGLASHKSTKQGRRRIAAALVATASLVFVSPTFADIIHVPDDFPTIQGAIDASIDGDEIVVAPGTYNEDIGFLGKAIFLRSSDGRETTTIDSGTVEFENYEGPDSILQGFTITGEGQGIRINWLAGPTIINCAMTGNSSDGIWSYDSRATIINCDITDNGGDGLDQFVYAGNGTYINCVFAGNGRRGAELAGYGSPMFLNCAFIDNAEDGLSLDYFVSGAVVNCTFVGNDDWGVAIGYFIDVSFKNCVLWDNGSGSFSQDDEFTVSSSDVDGGWPGEGNIDADPLFVDPGNGDYRLGRGSPCIDAGDNAAVPPDEFDLDDDGDTDEALPFDLVGNPRFVDDPDTKDTGNGKPPIVDMGPYEFQVVSCVWDLDGNDVVGTGDLILLLGSWGDPYGTADLIGLLGNWGPCPK